tara:strand:- start:233 stop:1288 length:1056 start_codon:yes stop_codon:yes gene_type:complete
MKLFKNIKKNFNENFINKNSLKILLIYRRNISNFSFLKEILKIFINKRFDLNKLIQEPNNSKEKVIIIKRTPPGAGLFSNYMLILEHLFLNPNEKYLIDWKYFKTHYNEKKAILGTTNAFEYYWNQPSEYDLDYVYKKMEYYISDDRCDEESFNFYDIETLLDKINLKKMHAASKTIMLNDFTQNYVEKIYKSLINNKETLGVFHRSTDYIKIKPKDHYIQPTIDQLVEKTKEFYNTKEFEQIFISSDDNAYIEDFKSKINLDLDIVNAERSLINNTKNRRSYDKKSEFITKTKANRENDIYLFGLEYLTDVYLLSKCKYFIGGFTSGTAAMFVMNNNSFEDKFLFDLGRY